MARRLRSRGYNLQSRESAQARYSDLVSVKEEVLRAIQSLPDDCSVEEILAEIYFKKQIDEGLRDVVEGRVVSHDEVKKRVGRWRESAGR